MAKKQGLENGVARSQAQTNGAAHNGTAEDQLLGSRRSIRRTEFIRLLEQSLAELGFENVARSLEKASGVACQAPEVQQLRSALLEGKWEEAAAVMDELGLEDAQCRRAKFQVLEEKYLEALHRNDTKAAVRCLRQDLQPLKVKTERLHELAQAVMCQDGEELCSRLKWPGPHSGREQLLQSLQAVLPPDILLPSRRLQILVEQAMELQLMRCRYHNQPVPVFSLLSDYSCGPEQIPSVTTQVLQDHTDEVWHIAFSHGGTMLASASRDNSAIIYSIDSLRRHGHTDAIATLAWSPDDSMLATCGQDRILRLWSSEDGRCIQELSHHTQQVSAVAWLPDSRRLVTGSHDKYLILAETDGTVLRTWPSAHIHDLAISSDGRLLFSVTSEKKVRVYDLASYHEVPRLCISEGAGIMSLSLADDNRHLLLNMTDQQIHLWQVNPDSAQPTSPGGSVTPPPVAHVMSYEVAQGQTGRYVVRSCLGGYNSAFVLSGSEESKVFVWHRVTGEQLAVLEGHRGTVNSVSWNPRDHHMFASASDDCSIRIWGPPQLEGSSIQNGYAPAS
eukprot:jgi/Astpho2/1993/Aster-00501